MVLRILMIRESWSGPVAEHLGHSFFVRLHRPSRVGWVSHCVLEEMWTRHLRGDSWVTVDRKGKNLMSSYH